MSIDPKQTMDAAKAFAAQHAVELAREMIEWQDTALLCDGRLRELAIITSPIDCYSHGMTIAEGVARRACFEALAAPAPRSLSADEIVELAGGAGESGSAATWEFGRAELIRLYEIWFAALAAPAPQHDLQRAYEWIMHQPWSEERALADQAVKAAAWSAKTEAPSAGDAITESMWGGLARDIMMAWDLGCKTPRKMFDALEDLGRNIPQWLRDEPEMKALDSVPSKGTRCVLIYKAMREAAGETAAPSVADETVALINECRAALAEELAGWDLDPPLHHVKQAHDKCDAWLKARAPEGKQS